MYQKTIVTVVSDVSWVLKSIAKGSHHFCHIHVYPYQHIQPTSRVRGLPIRLSFKWFQLSQPVSENSVPLNPMVLLIIIPIKWLFHWEYTLFSDKPIWSLSMAPFSPSAIKLQLIKVMLMRCHFILPSLEVVLGRPQPAARKTTAIEGSHGGKPCLSGKKTPRIGMG